MKTESTLLQFSPQLIHRICVVAIMMGLIVKILWKIYKIPLILLHAARLKGVLHLWALFLKILCIFSKNKATSDKVSYGSGQKCSKELKNYSFTSVETIVVKLQ